MKVLQLKFQKYKKNKKKEIEDLKKKRNKNIINFLNSINPIIEKYMADNSIYMLIDKKNVFIANNNYDITKKLIELIDNQIKTVEIKQMISLNKKEIEALLPHRDPMLLVDELHDIKKLTSLKNVKNYGWLGVKRVCPKSGKIVWN